MKAVNYILLAVIISFVFLSCSDDSSEDPNHIGGTTDLELTKVGNIFWVFPDLAGSYNPILNVIKDTVYISKNENGIVTTNCHISLTEAQYRALDTLAGTQNISRDVKQMLWDQYAAVLGATIDSSDKQNIRIAFEFKTKNTSEGIQDYVYSHGNTSKPFTIVKYDSKVGDKYEFKDEYGKTITRTVFQKNPVEDFLAVYYNLKTIRVEENSDNTVVDKIIYISNHKYGLVGVTVKLKTGKEINIKSIPPTLN
jgi:hypothetical protein